MEVLEEYQINEFISYYPKNQTDQQVLEEYQINEFISFNHEENYCIDVLEEYQINELVSYTCKKMDSRRGIPPFLNPFLLYIW